MLVIAVSLISSPFHAHHHEAGPKGYSSHAGQLDAGHLSFEQSAQDDELSLHFYSDNPDHRGGHSMSALQGTPIQLASSDSAPKFLALVPLFVLFGSRLSETFLLTAARRPHSTSEALAAS